MTYLILNAGSSSTKFALYDEGLRTLTRGQVAGLGSRPRFQQEGREETLPADCDHGAALDRILAAVEERLGRRQLLAAGHRIVHGGVRQAAPVRLDAALLAELEALSPLAPLHQPHNLAAVRDLARRRPDLPQVACFDTAFHRGHPPEADRLAIPRALHDKGVRRYGFHGLSYEHIASFLAEEHPHLAAGRVVVAHLGAGASLCALEKGRSVDTTMGFTALDGLPMATRPGALDPGVLLYLMSAEGMGLEALTDLLYNKCGLLGVSGISGDMRVLAESADPRAAEARRFYAYRVRREIAALAGVLGGLDGLVFTAGVGEHDAAIRAEIVEGLAWLGLALDAAANARHAPSIAAPESRAAILVVPADEEGVIAAATRALVPPAEDALPGAGQAG